MKTNHQSDDDNYREERDENRSPVGCRRLACGGCFSIVIICSIVIFLIATKPAFFWGPTVSFLNNGKQTPAIQAITTAESQKYIEDQITGFGESEIVVPEEYITPLVEEVLIGFEDPFVEVDTNGMHIYWTINKTPGAEPLLGKVTLSADEKLTIYATTIGFERFGIPEFFAKAITNAVESALQLTEGESNTKGLVERLFGTTADFDIKNIEFTQDELVLTIDISFSLFN